MLRGSVFSRQSAVASQQWSVVSGLEFEVSILEIIRQWSDRFGITPKADASSGAFVF